MLNASLEQLKVLELRNVPGGLPLREEERGQKAAPALHP